jgi:hypothetical protein
MAGVEKQLTAALHHLPDSNGGVVAQVERARNRQDHCLENRAKTMDVLLNIL